MEKNWKWRKCPICRGTLKSVKYLQNNKEGRKWVKVGYWCSVDKKFFSLEEIEGDKNEN